MLIYLAGARLTYEFWESVPELRPKLSIMGNSRSDLLGSLGKQYFSKDIEGLNTILVSDTLCREAWEVFPPIFNVSQRCPKRIRAKFEITG